MLYTALFSKPVKTGRSLGFNASFRLRTADKVIVVACEKESGTMHAVDWAVKLGKPIFAINNDRSGNRHLIDSGIATTLSLQPAL